MAISSRKFKNTLQFGFILVVFICLFYGMFTFRKLNQRMEDANEQNKKHKAENEHLSSQLKDAHNKRVSLEGSLVISNKKLKQVTADLRDREKNIKILLNEKNAKESSMNQINQLHDVLQSKYSSLLHDNKQLLKKHTKLLSEYQNLQSENVKANQKVQSLNDRKDKDQITFLKEQLHKERLETARLKESENKMIEQVSSAQKLYHDSVRKLDKARKFISQHLHLTSLKNQKAKNKKTLNAKPLRGLYQEWIKKQKSKGDLQKSQLGHDNVSASSQQTRQGSDNTKKDLQKSNHHDNKGQNKVNNKWSNDTDLFNRKSNVKLGSAFGESKINSKDQSSEIKTANNESANKNSEGLHSQEEKQSRKSKYYNDKVVVSKTGMRRRRKYRKKNRFRLNGSSVERDEGLKTVKTDNDPNKSYNKININDADKAELQAKSNKERAANTHEDNRSEEEGPVIKKLINDVNKKSHSQSSKADISKENVKQPGTLNDDDKSETVNKEQSDLKRDFTEENQQKPKVVKDKNIKPVGESSDNKDEEAKKTKDDLEDSENKSSDKGKREVLNGDNVMAQNTNDDGNKKNGNEIRVGKKGIGHLSSERDQKTEDEDKDSDLFDENDKNVRVESHQDTKDRISDKERNESNNSSNDSDELDSMYELKHAFNIDNYTYIKSLTPNLVVVLTVLHFNWVKGNSKSEDEINEREEKKVYNKNTANDSDREDKVDKRKDNYAEKSDIHRETNADPQS
ncbi:hypothetical protein TrispH2_007326 [Trichoplax sp. H2]|nr:hypothetical protein TrispH2_007326 [Trichoplax sp. H2]|eukprot:RDD40505.1 hypothetical protein TrispH2_007326 [Trichoplax sp. H2]